MLVRLYTIDANLLLTPALQKAAAAATSSMDLTLLLLQENISVSNHGVIFPMELCQSSGV